MARCTGMISKNIRHLGVQLYKVVKNVMIV